MVGLTFAGQINWCVLCLGIVFSWQSLGSPMRSPSFSWFRLPSRLALLLGMSALSAAGARADIGHQSSAGGTAPLSQTEPGQPGALLMWNDGERLYLSENNCPGEELRLQDTAEARRLRQLLQRHAGAANGVHLDRMILAGGGGMGISWERARSPVSQPSEGAAKAGNSQRRAEPGSAVTPRRAAASSNRNSGIDSRR